MLQSARDHPGLVFAALTLWVLLYVVYKVSWRRDFGLPVRRRLLCRRLHVVGDQVAYVPFWWSDLQVQRAIDAHWRDTMRRGFERHPATGLR